MIINRYIAISLVSHLLIFSLFGIMQNLTDTGRSVFNVNIVPPLESYKPAPEKKVTPEVHEKEPIIVKKRRRPPQKSVPRLNRPQPDNKLRPETLLGKGSGLLPDKSEEVKALNNENTSGEPDPEKQGDSLSSSEKADAGHLLLKEDGTSILPAPYLFDTKTIEKYARRGPSPQTGLSFDTPGFKHRGYLRMLKERIESIWQYPKGAAKRGISGDLYLVIIINRDGTLHELELLRTSGFVDLDESAIKALKKAFPWSPLPEDFEGDTLKITGHFIYIHGSPYAM